MAERNGEQARRLPSGPHGLPPELVARNQRERLIAAMAEVCAERGYEAATVVDVVRAAGVSTASFYRQFGDKRACMLTSFEELFGRLLAAVETSCAGEDSPAAKARAGIGTAVSLLAADPPTARLLTLEVAGVGVEGVRRQHEAIDRLAVCLHLEWTTVAAMVAVAGRRIAAEEPLDAAELEAVVARLAS